MQGLSSWAIPPGHRSSVAINTQPEKSSQPDLDRYPVADSAEFGATVPVIDIAAVARDPNGTGAADSIREIAAACREWGFFQVVNHGIPVELVEATVQQMRWLFAEPQDRKEHLLRTRENPWGYYNNELTKNQRDKKEVFDFTTDGADPIYGMRNRWPDGNEDFSRTMRRYLNACESLSLTLLQAFCVGLDLPPEHMHRHFSSGHTGFVRLNYYPVRDPMSGSTVPHQDDADLGVHHHTDAGALTVLLQDDVGGLQVYRDEHWHDIAPVQGALVINTGDMMQVWSNDLYQAAIHRVLAMQDRDRYSIPFFFNPAANTRVSPLSTTVTAVRPVRYRTIDWSDFRGKRTDGDYANYGPEVQISQYRF